MKKKNYLASKLCLIAILSIFVTSAVTYGFFTPNKTQSGNNSLSTGCFDVTFTNESASINLTNAYSVSDAKGMTSTPYSFTITNTCETTSAYRILLDTKSSSFSNSFVNASINGNAAKSLASFDTNTSYPMDEGYGYSYIVENGTLEQDESATIDVRLWINATTTYEDVAGKSWEGQVRVVSTVAAIDQQS